MYVRKTIQPKELVLVVDDSKMLNRAIVFNIKKETHLSCVSAYSYKETKEAIANNKESIVLAIVDLHLPDAIDMEAAQYTIMNNIPTIILTGDYSEEVRQELFEQNITDYYLKEGTEFVRQVVLAAKRILKNRSIKVLMVDDSNMYLSFCKKVLSGQLLDVFFAKDGVEALEVIKKHKDISVVLTDYNMPRMDGLELTKILRKSKSKEELSIIAISDSKNKLTLSKFLKLGANDFINKPFSKEELTARISSNLEILELFQESKDRANKDFLTGMFNRRYFFDEGMKLFNDARKKHISAYVAMFDIDKFKNINDTYGHDIGDIAIQEVARILDSHLAKLDAVVSRFGGEEFCVLLRSVELKQTKDLFEKIRKNFQSNIIRAGDVEFSYTVSIGIKISKDQTIDEAVKDADKNLYEAKQTGRNKVIIS